MNKSLHLFNIDGIKIKLHYSWFFIFALLWYSLSANFFPYYFPGYTLGGYILLGLASSILLFFSVLFHELMHSIVAKSHHIGVKEITLFFFGGVANISTERIKPKTEFWTAISGPLLSIYLGVLFLFISMIIRNTIFFPITFYIYKINLILGIFNLLPGYPLDGGRVLRSILHGITKNIVKATYIASQAGRLIAGIMIFFGIVGFFFGVNLFWFLILGIFLYYIAGVSFEQTLILDVLKGKKVKKYISKIKKVKPKTKVVDAIKRNYIKTDIIAVKNRKYHGLCNFNDLKKYPKETWKAIKVKDIAKKTKSVKSSDTLTKAYKIISEQKQNIIPVVDKGKFKGIIKLDTILRVVNKEVNFN